MTQATEILTTCRRLGVILHADGDNLKAKGPADQIKALLPAIRRHKPELLAALTGKDEPETVTVFCKTSMGAYSVDLAVPAAAVPKLLKARAAVRFTLAELEAAANRLCDAMGDDAKRRAVMLEDCREFPPERWGWLTDYLNAEATKHEQALPGNDPADDRRRCTECANFASGGRCLAAWRGELSGMVSRRYSPAQPERHRRCEGYAPGANDPDQRKGRERWPGLIQKGGE